MTLSLCATPQLGVAAGDPILKLVVVIWANAKSELGKVVVRIPRARECTGDRTNVLACVPPLLANCKEKGEVQATPKLVIRESSRSSRSEK